MALSIYLAKLFGLYFLIISFIFINRRKEVAKTLEDFFSNSGLMMTTGALNLLGGLALLIGHFHWCYNWQMFITLLGVLMLAKGVLSILHPSLLINLSRKIVEEKKYWRIYLSIIFVLGLYLTLHGFYTHY